MYSKYLVHYNHNHDKLGRFARSAGTAGGRVGSAVLSRGKKKKAAPEADVKKKGKAANTKLSESERNRIVKSGSAKEVQKYKDRLSTTELESAVNRLQQEKVKRIDLDKKLSDLTIEPKKKSDTIEKIEKYSKDLERVSNSIEKAAKMYNSAAKVHNLVSPANDQWPIYGEKKKGPKTDSPREKDLKEKGIAWREMTMENKIREEELKKRKLDDAEEEYWKKRKKSG